MLVPATRVPTAAPREGNIPKLASSIPELSTFLSLLDTAGLLGIVSSGELTVFAPTNEAFAKLPDILVTFVTRLENRATLSTLLQYHVLPEKLLSNDMHGGAESTLAAGTVLYPTKDTSGVYVRDSRTNRRVHVSHADIVATNGVLHLTNSVLVPGGLIDLFSRSMALQTPVPQQAKIAVAQQSSLSTLASSLPQLATFLSLLGTATLLGALGTGHLTVFAPTNDAFIMVGDALLSFLAEPSNKQSLAKVLKYHMLGNKVPSQSLRSGTVQTLAHTQRMEEELNVTCNSAGIRLTDSWGNTARVTQADVMTAAGIFHVIDTVLMPGAKDTMLEMMAAGPRVRTAQPATPGPLQEILSIPHLPSAPTDRLAQPNPCASTRSATASMHGSLSSIPILASSLPELSTLVSLISVAGVGETLSGGELTMFAPTNDAFAKLPTAVSKFLMDWKNKATLSKVVRYHVLPVRLLSADVRGDAVSTLEGSDVLLKVDELCRVSVGRGTDTMALVTRPDVMASNGLVHVVDTVLISAALNEVIMLALGITQAPTLGERASASIPALVSSLPELSTLMSLLGQAALVDTLDGDGLTLFAPTNDAFRLLPPKMMRFLTTPNNVALKAVLLYHVLSGRLLSAEIQRDAVSTLEGSHVLLEASELGGVTVAGGLNAAAHVIQANLMAMNGVVHLIDAVLVPPNLKDTVLGAVAAPPTIPNLASSMASLTPPSETSPCSGKSNLEGDSHCEFWVGEDARKCESTNYYQLNCALKCCETNPPPQIPTITFVSLLETAGLVETLSGGELTVFAP